MKLARVLFITVLLLVPLSALAPVAQAADVWTVNYNPNGFYGDNTYLFYLSGTSVIVYKHDLNWTYLGYYGQVVLPDGMPTIVFKPGTWQAAATRSAVCQ